MASPLLLETKSVSKVYGGNQPVYAIREIDLKIQTGEFLSIVGPSGSGKSTLMNTLGLLDRPTSGRLYYLGEDTEEWSGGRQSDFRNRTVGFIFQAHMLMPEFTALENVLIPSRIGRTYGHEAIQNAERILKRIGLGDRMHHRPPELSGGQNQRVAIARALVNDPRIVFADEPTGALDSKTSEDVYELMREINQQDQVTFVMVTHERTLAEKTDRVITILDGRIQKDEVKTSTVPSPR